MTMAQQTEPDSRIGSILLDVYLWHLIGLSTILNAVTIARMDVAPADVFRAIEVGIELFETFLGGDQGMVVSLMVVTWAAGIPVIILATTIGLGALGIHFTLLYGLRGLVWLGELRT